MRGTAGTVATVIRAWSFPISPAIRRSISSVVMPEALMSSGRRRAMASEAAVTIGDPTSILAFTRLSAAAATAFPASVSAAAFIAARLAASI